MTIDINSSIDIDNRWTIDHENFCDYRLSSIIKIEVDVKEEEIEDITWPLGDTKFLFSC